MYEVTVSEKIKSSHKIKGGEQVSTNAPLGSENTNELTPAAINHLPVARRRQPTFIGLVQLGEDGRDLHWNRHDQFSER
jgi:hypothetical protein